MVTNFDYLKKEPKFSAFADVAVSAEKIILLDPEASILNSRRAMEFAVKWMYSVDDAPLVGLTATPKDEIDKNTYNIFELEMACRPMGMNWHRRSKTAIW